MPNEDIAKMNGGKKFDICLMNPPYDGKLHLKFLAKTIEISNKVSSIEPFAWITRRGGKGIIKQCKDYIQDYGAEIEVLRDPQKEFGISLPDMLSINFIDTTNKKKIFIENLEACEHNVYDDVEKITRYGQDPLLLSFNKKIHENNPDGYFGNHCYIIKGKESLYKAPSISKDNHEFDNKWVWTHGTLAGNLSKDGLPSEDWYVMMSRNPNVYNAKPEKYNPEKLGVFYVFDTQEECQNIIDYVKTDFVRGILFMYKQGKNLAYGLPHIPWQDFKQHWDDKKLFAKYNITNDEVKRIQELLPDYYHIRK